MLLKLIAQKEVISSNRSMKGSALREVYRHLKQALFKGSSTYDQNLDHYP